MPLLLPIQGQDLTLTSNPALDLSRNSHWTSVPPPGISGWAMNKLGEWCLSWVHHTSCRIVVSTRTSKRIFFMVSHILIRIRFSARYTENCVLLHLLTFLTLRGNIICDSNPLLTWGPWYHFNIYPLDYILQLQRFNCCQNDATAPSVPLPQTLALPVSMDQCRPEPDTFAFSISFFSFESSNLQLLELLCVILRKKWHRTRKLVLSA